MKIDVSYDIDQLYILVSRGDYIDEEDVKCEKHCLSYRGLKCLVCENNHSERSMAIKSDSLQSKPSVVLFSNGWLVIG